MKLVGALVKLILILGFLVVAGGGILIALGNAMSSATASSEFTVRMDGTSGTPFTLQCMTTQGNGSSSSRSYQGSVPADYHETGHIVSCVGQKQGAPGLLAMRMIKGGKDIQLSQTSTAYGVVQAATQ